MRTLYFQSIDFHPLQVELGIALQIFERDELMFNSNIPLTCFDRIVLRNQRSEFHFGFDKSLALKCSSNWYAQFETQLFRLKF